MTSLPRKKSSALVAINGWDSYYNVRINNFNIVAGQETVVKVTPTKHTATSGFRSMALSKRQCLFSDEPEAVLILSIYT